MDDFCLILQGPPIDKEYLVKFCKYYRDQGIKNIIVSTYSNFVLPELHDYVTDIVLNDNIGQIKVKGIIKRRPEQVIFSYDKHELGQDFTPHANFTWHIITTRRGINKANEVTKCKYYIKVRADVLIANIPDLIDNWINNIFSIKNNEIFDHKIILVDNQHSPKFKRISFYFIDYLAIGSKDDLTKYYFFNKINKIGGAESMISSSYISEKSPGISCKEAKTKYFYFDSNIQFIFKKYNISPDGLILDKLLP